VDSPGEPGKDPLKVETTLGTLPHVGTQYQVRIQGSGIDVGVREGRVAISRADSDITGNAGEHIHVTSAGDIIRTALSPRDPVWAWTASTAAVFDINDRPLATFLEWVARETGRRLAYASPQAQSAAGKIRLKGSITGLNPDAALAAVLATTQLRRTGSDDAVLEIGLADAIDPGPGARPTH
jgi:ferric-dicitrate binding protein FerR (iron transport regulator)